MKRTRKKAATHEGLALEREASVVKKLIEVKAQLRDKAARKGGRATAALAQKRADNSETAAPKQAGNAAALIGPNGERCKDTQGITYCKKRQC